MSVQVDIKPEGWWMLECGHYGSTDRDLYEKDPGVLKCRVCPFNEKEMPQLRRRVEPVQWESWWQ